MSVQAGTWNLDEEPVDREFLARISRTLVEYGPDSEWTFFDGPIGMLYRPFHTTAESRLERQPHISLGGKVLIWDGRLDNRDELAEQLSHVQMDDKTDVAIVATAFDRWGAGCFSKLVGDWALSVWNPCERELTLARDYMGIRKLFYYVKRNRILWCNHLAPLALCGDQFNPCDQYIAGYLAADPQAHLTPYREIHAVPPGKFVRIHDGKITIHVYWTSSTLPKTRYKKDDEYVDQYRHLFRQAVRRRLRADSVVLADLSGGLDSSSIVCMADDILAKDGAVAPRVDTFSLYDSNEPGDDDLPHFTKIEEKRGRTGFHTDMQTSGDSLLFEYPTFIASPAYAGRTEVEAALSRVTKQGEYRVLLSGNGGDDINGQGLDPRVQMADLFVTFRLRELSKQLTAWSLLIRKRPWIQLLFQSLLQLMPASVSAGLTKQGKLEPWINPTFAKQHRMSLHQMGAVRGGWLLRPTVRSGMQTIAVLSRRMASLAPSIIEKRYPHLDQNLVEFLTSIPLDQLLRPGHRRFLMRRGLADLLPPEVLTRITKASAGRCYSVTLERHWSKVEDLFRFPVSSHLGYVMRDRIHETLLAMKGGQIPTCVFRLLRAVSLEVWLRNAEDHGVISIHSPASQTASITSGGTARLVRWERQHMGKNL